METASSTRHFSKHDQLQLALTVFDAQKPALKEPNLLFLHGFGQNQLSWHHSANRFARAGWASQTLDARGHGDSAWSATGAYELDDFLADLRSVRADMAEKPILIGASMGGLLGILAEGESVAGEFAALVLIDVTPRWETKGVERIFNFMHAHPNGFADLSEAQAAVSSYLPHRDNADPNRLRGHLRQRPDGRLRWHWDPKILSHIPHQPNALQPRLEAAAANVRCPVLLISGAKSDVVSEQTVQAFLAQVPHAQHRSLADATHMVVGEQNDPFTHLLEAYLNSFSEHPSSLLKATP